MLSSLIALVVGIHGQTQVPSHYDPPYFSEVVLGKDGVKAFMSPDRVTVQRVFPSMFDQVELTLGKQRLLVAGGEHSLPSDLVAKLTQELSRRQPPNETLCMFHPDHVIRYRKGFIAIEIVTCFTCHAMIISKNGVRVNGGMLSWMIERETLDRYIPFVEQQRAAVDESAMWSGFYDAMFAASSVTAQAVVVTERFPIYKFKSLSDAKLIEDRSVEKLRYLIGAICMMKLPPQSFGSGGEVPLNHDVLVTFNGQKTVKILFPDDAGDPVSIRPDGAVGYKLPKLIRDGFSKELVKYSSTK